MLASSSGVDSEAAAPSARGMAAARLLATDGPVPATKLSSRVPSGALPAPSVSLAAAEPAEKPRSASIVGQWGFSQCPLWLAGQLEQRKGFVELRNALRRASIALKGTSEHRRRCSGAYLANLKTPPQPPFDMAARALHAVRSAGSSGRVFFCRRSRFAPAPRPVMSDRISAVRKRVCRGARWR